MIIKVGIIGSGKTTEDAIRPDLRGIDSNGNEIEVGLTRVLVSKYGEDYAIIEVSESDIQKLDRFKVNYTIIK